MFWRLFMLCEFQMELIFFLNLNYVLVYFFNLLSHLKRILYWQFQIALLEPVLEGTDSGRFVYVRICECKLSVPHGFCFFIFYCKFILYLPCGILCPRLWKCPYRYQFYVSAGPESFTNLTYFIWSLYRLVFPLYMSGVNLDPSCVVEA